VNGLCMSTLVDAVRGSCIAPDQADLAGGIDQVVFLGIAFVLAVLLQRIEGLGDGS